MATGDVVADCRAALKRVGARSVDPRLAMASEQKCQVDDLDLKIKIFCLDMFGWFALMDFDGWFCFV